MNKNIRYSIPENSAIWQGHVGQYISIGNISYKISSNFFDYNKDSGLNTEKYRHLISDNINAKTGARKSEGGDFHQINANDIKIEPIKLVDDEDDDICGYLDMFPSTALCTKDGCNHFFTIKEGRKCGHSDTDPRKQFTFVSFCDDCGLTLPLPYRTNVNQDCSKCGAKKGLSKLRWVNQDDIHSYRLKCIKCGDESNRLYFYDCNHKLKGQCHSKLPPSRSRGVPIRSNTIIHPCVKSIPDIPQEDETDKKSGRRTSQARQVSEAFNDFFGSEIPESTLYLPEFRDLLLKEEDFWKLPKVNSIIEDVLYDLRIKSDVGQYNRDQFIKIVRRILKSAKTSIQDGAEMVMTRERYGIDSIGKSLNYLKYYTFDDVDLQGINLLYATHRYKRDIPKTFSSDYKKFLNDFGLRKIIHHPDITMIQALLGIIEGSTRRNPLLFRTIETGKIGNRKPTVYIRDFPTEGILFTLNCRKVLNWLNDNEKLIRRINVGDNINILPNDGVRADIHYRNLISKDGQCKEAATILLHTYSHMLIQQSTVDTGLDIQSISEIIYPSIASIFIYSTNSINIGGLEYTFDYHLEDWFGRMKELANDCPQDPACMIDERGACNVCSYIPEFVCHNFNEGIDRSTLVGKSDRFVKGYLI